MTSSIAYLKFDLGTTQAPILSAQLTVYCTNASSDGGVVYRVANSSWMEGNQTGTAASSASGPRLKWFEVDTNGDGAVDGLDSSPYVPVLGSPIAALGSVVAGQAVSADVTSAFQGAAGLVSLAIRTTNTNGATYSSRENPTVAQRPRLRLTFGSAS